MSESSQSVLAFDLFKEQANKDLKELAKDLPKGTMYITTISQLTNFVQSLLDPRVSEEISAKLISWNSLKKSTGSANVLVIAPADRDVVEEICEKFQLIPNYTKSLFVIPRNTALVQQVIEKSGFTTVSRCDQVTEKNKQIILKEFHADFIPADVDLFLMPSVRSFYQTVVENDFNDLYACARSLAKIQAVFGGIPQVLTIGQNAERVRDLMDGIISQTGSASSAVPHIDTLVIIDRSTDLVSPLMTPDTTESLLDMFLGIEFGWCTIPDGRESEMYLLTQSDECFSRIRHMNYIDGFNVIREWREEQNRLAEAVKNTADHEQFISSANKLSQSITMIERYNRASKYIGLLHEKVSKDETFSVTFQSEYQCLRYGSSLSHIAENFVTVFNDWFSALRLICLMGAASQSQKAEKIQKLVISEFGMKALEPIATLEKLKLLSNNSVPWWSSLAKELGCFNEKDPMYDTCHGFIPVTVQLVKKATDDEWSGPWTKGLEEKGLPVKSTGHRPQRIGSDETRRVLVFFVGGVTLFETAFIRRMSTVLYNDQVQFIVGSTNATNSKKFMNELCPGLFKE